MDALPLESDHSLVFLFPGQHKQQCARVLGPRCSQTWPGNSWLGLVFVEARTALARVQMPTQTVPYTF